MVTVDGRSAERKREVDRVDESVEPSCVWEVWCSCGYSEMFRWKGDAREVFDAHTPVPSDGRRCGSAHLKAKHAYPRGGVDPEKTLPYDVSEDPNDLTDPDGVTD